MGWIGSYLDVAIFVALVAFIISDGRAASVVAGITWPVLVVGLAQFLLIVAVAKSVRVRPAIRST